MNIFKSVCFSFAKKGAGADPKKIGSGSRSNFKSAPDQLKSLGSDRPKRNKKILNSPVINLSLSVKYCMSKAKHSNLSVNKTSPGRLVSKKFAEFFTY